jgi:glycogen debranching enzyme
VSRKEKVSSLHGDTFVVSDLHGDIDASPTDPEGLFSQDTRFLSRWRLTVNGVKPGVLSTDDLQYDSAQFFLVPTTGTIYVDAALSIRRVRRVSSGIHEEITVLNHSPLATDVELRIEAASDFADLFEVKDALPKKGERYQRVEKNALVLGYRRNKFVRETRIQPSTPANIDERGLSFRAHVEPHGEWTTEIDVSLSGFAGGQARARTRPGQSVDTWVKAAPQLTSSWPTLERTYERSLVDLAALRFYPLLAPGEAVPAAGLPWFMALFGRDSIITSLQALPFAPELAETTLRVLGLRQGTRLDEFRDEEPGKILHESRQGELTAFEERPHSPYFGSADATPLFLVLLDEYERWTGNEGLVRELERPARAALEWIDKYGDRDGDGYVEYQRKRDTGLENQCWKDSPNSIIFADGSMSKLPRACCEIQGYAYDAKVRAARLARQVWGDHELANRLERQAAELKRRFNRDFWVAERQFFALALDGDKRQVDSLTSNIGHLLWSGIVDDDKIDACVRHLMSDALYSGWGVRTMARGEGGYNPIGYHLGTVWPHDNSIIALGLRRCGRREEAARVALGILDAARYFDYRLPEAFAGYERSRTRFPVEYPTACSPQAWATGAPLLLLRALLGLEPVDGRLLVDPAVPTTIERVELIGIAGRWGIADAFGRGRIETR